MQNTYYSVIYTKPVEFAQNGYMAVDASGNATLLDATGNVLVLPFDCEYYIPTPTAQNPSWGV